MNKAVITIRERMAEFFVILVSLAQMLQKSTNCGLLVATTVFVCVFRYNELLFIIDTCQGASMYERFYSPNLMALASSQVGEDSLSVSYPPRHRKAKFPSVVCQARTVCHMVVEDQTASLHIIPTPLILR